MPLVDPAACAGPAVALGEAGAGETLELIENFEFEFEFDGVDEGFEGGFADVILGKFETDEDEIHAETDGVDDDQLHHHDALFAVENGAEEADGVDDVDGGDDAFLNAEHGQLDFFHNSEFGSPPSAIGAVAAGCENDRRDLQGDGIPDDHGEHEAEDSS